MIQKENYSVVFIGAGNVATHLAKRLHKKDYDILQIASRSVDSARELSLLVNASYTTDIKKINKSADIYIICTPDDEIEKVASHLKLPKKLVLHTSGSVNMDVLKRISSNIGVLYPLQSFSKQVKTSFSSVPLLIESSNALSHQIVKQIASSLGKNISEINSENRLKLHLAATMVNNFGNYLFALSSDFLSKEKVSDFQILMPLIKQTVKKIKHQNPFNVQTGPAKRGDAKTTKKHLALLKKYPEQRAVYELLTELIKKHYEPKL